MDVRLFNVIILGLGFMLVFTAFQTMSNIQVCRIQYRVVKFDLNSIHYRKWSWTVLTKMIPNLLVMVTPVWQLSMGCFQSVIGWHLLQSH